jgi:hypothetical protein
VFILRLRRRSVLDLSLVLPRMGLLPGGWTLLGSEDQSSIDAWSLLVFIGQGGVTSRDASSSLAL